MKMNTTRSEELLNTLSRIEKLTRAAEMIAETAQALQRELVEIQVQVYQLEAQTHEKENQE